MLRIFINSLILLNIFIFNSISDVMFEMEYKENSSQTVDKTSASIKDDKLKMDFYEGGSLPTASMIYRGDRNEMITLDHKAKSYFIMDKNTMNQLSGQMDDAMAQMEEVMKNMSPQEREMMNKMMKGKMSSMMKQGEYIEPVLKQAGKGNVNGYACTKYDVFKGSEKIRQHCVTKWSNIEGGNEIQSSMLKMSNFMEQWSKSLSGGTSRLGSTMEFERNVFKQMSKLNGFPVQTIDYSNSSVSGVSTFKSSRKTSLDPSVFEPLPGYKKQEIGL